MTRNHGAPSMLGYLQNSPEASVGAPKARKYEFLWNKYYHPGGWHVVPTQVCGAQKAAGYGTPSLGHSNVQTEFLKDSK